MFLEFRRKIDANADLRKVTVAPASETMTNFMC